MIKAYSYLALGDSYTVGEQVRLADSFPYQTTQLLRKAISSLVGRSDGLYFMPPEIVAATGFTTDELIAAIDKTVLLPKYDFVSLLVGVNNQYRGRSVESFAVEFEDLLQRAIQFAGGGHECVFVLSIPDWGVTPFAKENDASKIAREIDVFNSVCERLAKKYNSNFVNITEAQRIDGTSDEFLTDDKLHPSAKEYSKWAALLSEKVISCIIG